ncbi:MAG: hypothetical protein PSV23_09180 [Brevundimonas sp.]|uniref:hypothetical protein n=1 Tax=Brevundimonas sp. TaxID=1871086 RepID=UPI002489AF5C|nr:hypothetical protein [Brevundimonas sp.]MDI1326954.1 hypothetical protein [Brevundimonas sp.]
MPRRRPPRPYRPKPTEADLERQRLVQAEQWRHAVNCAWTQMVVEESWRLVGLEGLRACGRAEFERGARSLIDQGLTPPPNWERLI